MTEQPSRMLYDDTDPDEIEDVSPELVEEDFDFGALVEGILPTRKRVRIYPNGHLLGQVEELVERIDAAESDDEAAALLEQFETLNARMRQAVVIVVEGRSSERLSEIEREAYRGGVPNPAKIAARLAKSKLPEDHPKRDEMQADADRGVMEVMLRQIADQIVHPTKGVSVDALKALRAKAEPELDRIYRACREANSQSVGVSPDFSPGRSGSRLAG